MNSLHKILLIDKAPDRKERIRALKSRGYAVFPALRLEEARSRCMRGGYDLIVVNAGDEGDAAVQFCEEIREQCPKQLVLLCTQAELDGDYTVSPDIQSLTGKVDDLLQESTAASDYASAA